MTNAMDLFRLDGKVALVTCGARGLGFFAAEASRYVSGAKLVMDGGFTINAGV